MKKGFLALLVFMGVLTLAACSVDIDRVSVSASTVEVEVGSSETVTATVHPESAPQNVTWESANEAVATVDAGAITGVKVGTTTVTVRAGDEFALISVRVVAATDNDDDDDVTPGTAYPDDGYVQGITATTITVGNTAATTGAFSAVGIPFNAAIEAYFAMVNENGGIGGRKIEFIHYNDDFNAATGLTNTRRLIDEDEVFALVGHFGTPTVGATIDEIREEGIPAVYYATGISVLFDPAAEGLSRSSFPVQPIFDAEGEVMVARASDEYDAKKIGVIYTSDDAGQGILNGVRIRANILGIDLVEQSVEPGATDMSSAATAIMNANVDAVIVATNQAPFVVATKALYEAGNTLPVFTSYVSANESEVQALETEVASDQFPLYANAWVNIFDEEGQMGFSDEYWTFAAELPEYATNAFAMAGWIAAHFFVTGLERVGDDELTWFSYVEAMESAPVDNPFGGIVDFTNGRRAGTQSMSLLQASISGEGEDTVYEWNVVRPIQDIKEILGE